jgi:hypothetical protein
MAKESIELGLNPADRNPHFDRLNLRNGTLRRSRFCDIWSEKSIRIFRNSPIANSSYCKRLLVRLQNHCGKFTSVFVGCILLFALLGIQKAGAESGHARGIWYDVAGIDRENLNGDKEINKLKKQGFSRVHIVVSSSAFSKMGLPCVCVKEMYGEKNYQECKKEGAAFKKTDEVKKCAAGKHIFGFDTWLRLDKQGNPRPHLGEFVDRLNKAGLQVILTIWPEPTRRYINSLNRLANFVIERKHNLIKHKVYGIELEDEENWDKAYTGGDFGGDLGTAADALISTLRAKLPVGTQIGATSGARNFIAEQFSNDKMLVDEHLDFISLQAYQDVITKNKPDETKISGNYAPGTMQQNAIGAIKRAGLDKMPLILGLPAYQQEFDSIPSLKGNGAANMYRAAKVAICGDADAPVNLIGHSYWSEANIVGARKKQHPYATDFLTDCPVSKIVKHCADNKELAAVCPGITVQPRK